jgi:hypothetical protein
MKSLKKKRTKKLERDPGQAFMDLPFELRVGGSNEHAVFSVGARTRLREVAVQAAALTEEGGFKLNVATITLQQAKAYAKKEFQKHGKQLEEEIPDFDKNFKALKKKLAKALDVPRIDMPVIEPADMAKFQRDLQKGRVDILRPFAKGKLYTPKNLSKKAAKDWIELGYHDGSRKDDKVYTRMVKVPANRLFPTQSQIWLEKLIANIAKFGVPSTSSPIVKATVIASREGYILDGHHRFGQAMLANPSLALSALRVPVNIKLLLKVGRSYGAAIGNQAKG